MEQMEKNQDQEFLCLDESGVEAVRQQMPDEDDPDYLERQLNIIKVIEQIYRSSHDKVIETL